MNGDKRATIRDVADLAGVSIATVSRVLNQFDSVDPVLTQRVRSAVDKLGYIPNVSGRTLRGKNSKIFAAIVPNLLDPFYVDVISAFEKEASAYGYHMLLCNSNEKCVQEEANLRVLKEQNLAGLLFGPVAELPPEIEKMYQLGSAIVLLDRPVSDTRIPWVGTDYDNVGRSVAKFFRAQDVSQPLIASSRTTDSPLDERAEAFWSHWKQEGETRLEINVDYTAPPAMSDLVRVLEEAIKSADAVFCTNGPATRIVYDALYRQLQIQPERLSFLGFDNSPWCPLVTPSPTLVEQDVENIGIRAAQMLIAQAEQESKTGEHQRVGLEDDRFEVVIRTRQTSPKLENHA